MLELLEKAFDLRAVICTINAAYVLLPSSASSYLMRINRPIIHWPGGAVEITPLPFSRQPTGNKSHCSLPCETPLLQTKRRASFNKMAHLHFHLRVENMN